MESPSLGFSQKVRKEVITAIVTINCDLFHQQIVPYFQLEASFDAIISSAEYGITSKVDLCKLAAQELIGSEKIDQALLIDDKQNNTESFEEAGGQSLLYQGEELFLKQVRENPLLFSFATN